MNSNNVISARPQPSPRLGPRRLGIAALLAAIALMASACGSINISVGIAEDGSGVRSEETLDLDLSDIDSVEVSDIWDVEITVDDQDPSVAIVLDDNFADYTDVKVDGSVLRIGFTRGNLDPNITPTATVTVPTLVSLEAGGATSVVVEGDVTDLIDIQVEGASTVEVASLEVDTLDIELEGAADILITGAARRGNIDMNGSSSAHLSGLTWSTVDIDLNGASDLLLTATDSVSGKAEGSSDVTVGGGAAIDVSTSGASDVRSN